MKVLNGGPDFRLGLNAVFNFRVKLISSVGK